MEINEATQAKPEDKEALKKLVRSISFAGFIVDDALNDLEIADKKSFTLAELRDFGCVVARSTELVATSIATGEWTSPDESMEDVYANLIRPWLARIDEVHRDSLTAYLYGNKEDL